MGVVHVFSCSHFSAARTAKSKSWLRLFHSIFVLHCFCLTHEIAVLLSEYNAQGKLLIFRYASPSTIAKNSPILFVPSTYGPRWKTCVPVSAMTPRNSITPGLPEHAASTASAGRIGDRSLRCRSLRYSISRNVFFGIGCKSCFGFSAGGKTFVFGSNAFDLCLTCLPRIVDSRFAPLPNYIKFCFLFCHVRKMHYLCTEFVVSSGIEPESKS